MKKSILLITAFFASIAIFAQTVTVTNAADFATITTPNPDTNEGPIDIVLNVDYEDVPAEASTLLVALNPNDVQLNVVQVPITPPTGSIMVTLQVTNDIPSDSNAADEKKEVLAFAHNASFSVIVNGNFDAEIINPGTPPTPPSVTINNISDLIDAGFYQGQEITFEVSYVGVTDNQSTIQVGWAPPFQDFIQPTIESLGGITPDGSVTISYTTPTGFVTAGEDSVSSDLIVFINAIAQNDNQVGVDVFIDEATRDAALSVDSFSTNELSSYSYNESTDEVTLESSAEYSVYNLAGSTVAEGEGTVISLAGLNDGIYIIATSIGNLKIVKY